MQRGRQRKFFFNSAQLLTLFSEGKNACMLRRVETEKNIKSSSLTLCFHLNLLYAPRSQILTLLFASQLDLRGVWKSCMVYLVLSNLFLLSQTAVYTHSSTLFYHLWAKLVHEQQCSAHLCQLCLQDLLGSDHLVLLSADREELASLTPRHIFLPLLKIYLLLPD